MENRFEDRYQSGDTPWDHNRVDENLAEIISQHSIMPSCSLEIGCGTGDNAIWLTQQGFTVVACDLSATAIERACEKAARRGLDCRFMVADFLVDEIPGAPFGFIFDRGCLHCIHDAAQRAVFSVKVAGLLEAGGLWLTLVGNADEPDREVGPPQWTAAELVSIAEPNFEVLSLRSGWFGSDQDDPPRAWICLLRKR